MEQQKAAVDTGYWPLYRFDPAQPLPFHLDSRSPKLPLSAFTEKEARFAMLARAHPEEAARLAALGQEDVDRRRHVYEQMAQVDHSTGDEETEKEDEE
jgi:pyruvate-ferredoxin/flavodoxin oxidoreductase